MSHEHPDDAANVAQLIEAAPSRADHSAAITASSTPPRRLHRPPRVRLSPAGDGAPANSRSDTVAAGFTQRRMLTDLRNRGRIQAGVPRWQLPTPKGSQHIGREQLFELPVRGSPIPLAERAASAPADLRECR
jgi:hypothetical protein